MLIFKIRFNTKHNNSKLKWRVLIEDIEYLAEKIIITCPVETLEEYIKSEDMLKYHITCNSNNFGWIDNTLYIK